MQHPPQSMSVRCQVIGEFIDEGEGATSVLIGPSPSPVSVIEKTHVIGSFEEWGEAEPSPKNTLQQFVVLLNNKERLTVRGSGLRYLPGGGDQGAGGTYAIVVNSAGKETIVALLKQAEVIGIVPADTTGQA